MCNANSNTPCLWYGLWMRIKGPHNHVVTTLNSCDNVAFEWESRALTITWSWPSARVTIQSLDENQGPSQSPYHGPHLVWQCCLWMRIKDRHNHVGDDPQLMSRYGLWMRMKGPHNHIGDDPQFVSRYGLWMRIESPHNHIATTLDSCDATSFGWESRVVTITWSWPSTCVTIWPSDENQGPSQSRDHGPRLVWPYHPWTRTKGHHKSRGHGLGSCDGIAFGQEPRAPTITWSRPSAHVWSGPYVPIYTPLPPVVNGVLLPW